MKTRSILFALSVASVLFSTPFVSRPSAVNEEETEMEEHMMAINKGTKSLRKIVADVEQTDAALEMLAELEGHALAVKGLVPQKFAKVAEDDQAEFMVGFKSGIIDLISGMLEVELAVLEERQDDAAASLKNLLRLKNPSHKQFKIKKKK